MAGKFGGFIEKAREEATPSVKPDDQLTIEPEVNLCVKVPKSQRQHWAAEAKRSGTTMTSVIIEALTQKFGLPDNQK